MSQLVFVITDTAAKVPDSQRGLIRRHCMLKKNKQPFSRRSRREARLRLAAAQEHEETLTASTPPTSLELNRQQQGPVENDGCTEGLTIAQAQVIPRPPPPDWALHPFPIELDRTSQAHFHRYFACNPIRDAVLPFKLFDMKIDVFADNKGLSEPLVSDQLYFRALDLVASTSNDLIRGRGLTKRSRHKLQELLPMLNKRLAQPDAHKNVASLCVVLLLSAIAVVFGDHLSFSVHARGISEILRLRGITKSDPDDIVLLLTLDRLSFSGSILTEQWTPVRPDNSIEVPTFPDEVMLLYEEQAMVRPDFVPDPRLAVVFHVLQCTAILLDTHDFGAPSIDGARLHEALSFVHLQLLRLRGQLANGVSKCILLSLMAFLSTTFRVPNRYEHPCCGSLAKPLRAAYEESQDRIEELPRAVQTWLQLVGVMTASGVDNESALAAWRCASTISQGDTWEAARQEARRVMWIDSVHDVLGRKAFDSLRHR